MSCIFQEEQFIRLVLLSSAEAFRGLLGKPKSKVYWKNNTEMFKEGRSWAVKKYISKKHVAFTVSLLLDRI